MIVQWLLLRKAEASWVARAWEGIPSLSTIDLEKKHCSLLSKAKAHVSLWLDSSFPEPALQL